MGWAIIQIAHLSMIPTLAKNEGDDVELNSIRQVMFPIACLKAIQQEKINTQNSGKRLLCFNHCLRSCWACY